MPFRRLLVPALPFMALLFAACIVQFSGSRDWRRKIAIGAAGIVVAVNVLPAFGTYPTSGSLRARFHYNWNVGYRGAYEQWKYFNEVVGRWVVLGKRLKEYTNPGDSLVIGTIGAVGYFSDLFIYDRNGLVTPAVAKRPHSGKRRSAGHDKLVRKSFFIPKRPTYLEARIVRTADASEIIERKQNKESEVELRDYEWVAIPVATAKGFPRDISLLLNRRLPEQGNDD